MSVTPIHNALPGEDLIAIEPELLQQSADGWLHRLSLYAGRTLTAPALQSEQKYRAGRLATLGQSVTQGTVRGLELKLDLKPADPGLLVMPGYGISATGEDCALVRPLQCSLSSVMVIDPQYGVEIALFPDYAANPAHTKFAGVFVLQPVTAEVTGSSVDSGALPVVVSGNLAASCDEDPLELAFEDSQIADGVRLVLVAWPGNPTLALPSLAPSVTWRNRLAYTVFHAEAALGFDERLPWEMFGVPLALSGFDSNWRPLFADRSSVVRVGGLPRRRYVFPVKAGQPGSPSLIQPAMAQARITQLAEELIDIPGLPPAPDDFVLLPPCGILPAAAVDFPTRVALWFPSAWAVEAAPIHQEEVETALRSSMTAQPLNVSAGEVVELLVPLPDAVYDPAILQTEIVDPVFAQEVATATTALTRDLQHRELIRQEANALASALSGTKQAVLIDLNAGLTDDEITARDGVSIITPDPNEAFGTAKTGTTYTSTDLQNLLNVAANPPYTFTFNTTDANGKAVTTTLQLLNATDIQDLLDNGLQHFTTSIQGKVSRANDLIDLAFLTAQSDIYRFRQNVLGANEATRLAISPIVANIAQGESAAATSDNLRTYLESIRPLTSQTVLPVATPSPTTPATGVTGLVSRFRSFVPPTVNQEAVLPQTVSRLTVSPALETTSTRFNLSDQIALGTTVTGNAFQLGSQPISTKVPATVDQVLQQSPVVGAQLNLRTLTIAQRLQQSPSQDGIFYSVGNRVAFLELLADLEITLDDIPIVLDKGSAPQTVLAPSMFHVRAGGATAELILSAVRRPTINNDSDESDLFSTGIRVLEQHSQLLRAVEARIQQYLDFLRLVSNAAVSIQTALDKAQSLLAQLDNDLTSARQNLGFVNALLLDETKRVNDVNQQRAYVLQMYVPFVVYARGRTLTASEDVPSRQLVPGNVVSPVPSCLAQSVAIPPELREIVALLREAPVAWLPAVSILLNRLERPSILQQVAVNIQARAATQLQLPLRASSAESAVGIYAPVISNIFSANQQTIRGYQAQRATFDTTLMVNRSWASQVSMLQSVSAVADLISSEAVHAEVVNTTSRIMQQISSVATCLYARVGQALPVERLEWAEFLRAPGVSTSLQTLSVLPNWNTQAYVARQQMQLLVDWLYQQIDSSISAAVAFMSDVVRVAILLASHAPVDDVIAGAVALRTKPAPGGIVKLTLPSDRVAKGMYVQLYSSGSLAAHAVVDDLDSSGVTARFTTVYRPEIYLEANDVVHYTAQAPNTVALKAFSK